MNTTDEGIIWFAYARLSRKKAATRRQQRYGRRRLADESTERQVHLIREHAADDGVQLREDRIYTDNGRSAWKEGAERPGWAAMLAAAREASKTSRVGLRAWKIDRFTRNGPDGEDLLKLGALLDGPGSGRIDPSTADGEKHLRDAIAAAIHYSHDLSEKINAAAADMRASGYRPQGGRPFGFEVLSDVDFGDWAGGGDDDESRFAGPAAVVREAEAVIIRELARRLLAGESLRAMIAWLGAEGIATPRGGTWAPTTLTRMLGNPINGGYLTHKGAIVAKLANVEPILDTETYEAVQAKLGARKQGRRPGGRYPLSGVLWCGNPDCPRRGTMSGQPASGTHHAADSRMYVCPRSSGGCGQSVVAAPAEAVVRDEVVARLADAAVREAARAADVTLDAARAKLRGLLADLDADMDETAAKLLTVPRSAARLRARHEHNLDIMTARYEATEAELADLGPAAAAAPPLPAVTAEQWDKDVPAADQAAYIRRLGLHITIRKATPGRGPRLPFDTGRVHVAG